MSAAGTSISVNGLDRVAHRSRAQRSLQPMPDDPWPALAAGRVPDRVLDITSVVMGPYCTQILGDLGADVISVEPAGGEANRAMGPGPLPQLSGVALNLLRNKRNVSLNFKHPAGRQALLDIAATCDVFVTNLRPATAAPGPGWNTPTWPPGGPTSSTARPTDTRATGHGPTSRPTTTWCRPRPALPTPPLA